MVKLLIISPHWSTGGSCQVTLNKIELIKDQFEIKVVEYNFLSWQFVVQRNKVIELVGKDNFHTLGENKLEDLKGIIASFNPDVIAMEEFPEMFMDKSCSDWLYSHDGRPYIIETTHDSSFDPKKKIYSPDEFVFVSAYNALKYSHFNIKSSIIEYPVNTKLRQTKKAKDKLGFEEEYKHVVIVGLFTKRKNQKYAFYLAERLLDYNIKFHFVGNQAENFADYWKPLMDKKPDNCIIWGERDDIDTFLNASDLFLFPSKGDRGNKELNPIVIKEAQEYVDLPKLIFNLDVYLNKYNNAREFHFLTGDLIQDTNKIIELTKCKSFKGNVNEEIIIIGAYPNTLKREQLTIECIESVKKLNRAIMLVSHYPVSAEIQKMVDFYVFDSHNPLTHHSYYTHFYRDTNDYYAQVNINGLNDTNQSLCVLTNLYNGFKTAQSLGFERAFYLTFDVIVDRKDLRAIDESFSKIKDYNRAYLATLDTPFGKGIQTNGMTFSVPWFIKTFDDVRTPDEFNEICQKIGCQNFLEDYLIKTLEHCHEKSYELVDYSEQTLLKHSGLGVSSNSEYYSILPIENEPDAFMFYFFTYNQDEREIAFTFTPNKGGIKSYLIPIKYQNEFKHKITYDNDTTKITIQFNDSNKNCIKMQEFVLSPDTIDKFKNNGIFREKGRPKYKIKLLHLQTTLNDEREQKSREQLQEVAKYGWQYVLHSNQPYMDLPPKFNCQRPDCVSYELFDEPTLQRLGTALTPAHYGCFESFKNGILSEFDDELDFLIVCEGDCKLELNTEDFVYEVERIAKSLNGHHIGFHSFGDTKTLEHGWEQSPIIEDVNDKAYITNHIIGLQCVMFPKRVKKYLKEKLLKYPWDAADLFFNSIFSRSEYKMSIVKKRLTSQFDGYSLIDKQEKKF